MAAAVNQYYVINNVNESWQIHFLLGYLTAETGFCSNCNAVVNYLDPQRWLFMVSFRPKAVVIMTNQ